VRAATGLDDGIAYLRPGPFYDNRDGADGPWDPSAFRLFIDRAFVDFRSARATRLLIDLRDNPGGDNSFSDHLLAYIANRPFRFAREFDMRASPQTRAAFAARIAEEGAVSSITARLQAAMAGVPDGAAVKFEIEATPPREEGRFEGQVFALINRHSYSNAVMVAATLQDYGFGTLLGEETADLGSTLGAMERFSLPRTGFSVGYPKARILRPNGNPQPRGVVPEVRIATPLNASSEDEVLEQALQWIRAS
jgi:C-terminal processing protease CtpA/Prc